MELDVMIYDQVLITITSIDYVVDFDYNKLYLLFIIVVIE